MRFLHFELTYQYTWMSELQCSGILKIKFTESAHTHTLLCLMSEAGGLRSIWSLGREEAGITPHATFKW